MLEGMDWVTIGILLIAVTAYAAVVFYVRRRIAAEDGSFLIVYLGDGRSAHRLELTWLQDRTEKYDLGDNEIHLAFRTDHYAEALKRHKEMGVVCYENPAMGIYFINDPDNYWLEIVPAKK